jgi:hypothetical protein
MTCQLSWAHEDGESGHSRVVDEDVDVFEFCGQFVDKTLYFFYVADVELEGQHFDALRVSSRRAVRISFKSSGCVRANSMAVDFPMPEDAPVTTIVLPLRRCAMLDDILAACSWAMLASGVVTGVLRGPREAWAKAEDV